MQSYQVMHYVRYVVRIKHQAIRSLGHLDDETIVTMIVYAGHPRYTAARMRSRDID